MIKATVKFISEKNVTMLLLRRKKDCDTLFKNILKTNQKYLIYMYILYK